MQTRRLRHLPDGAAPWALQPGRWLLRWVLIAWVLATLAPGLSRVWAHVQGPTDEARAGWIEVCTPRGMDWVKPDGTLASQSGGEPADKSTPTLDACPHCTLAADRLLPLWPTFQWASLSPSPVGCPEQAGACPSGASFTTAHARGPPHIS